MTGGQVAPTTKEGRITATTPRGSEIPVINTQGLITSNKKFFYARTSPFFKEHMGKCIKEAMEHEGFAFVEIISPCVLNFKRWMKKEMGEIKEEIKSEYVVVDENRLLKDNELGIYKK